MWPMYLLRDLLFILFCEILYTRLRKTLSSIIYNWSNPLLIGKQIIHWIDIIQFVSSTALPGKFWQSSFLSLVLREWQLVITDFSVDSFIRQAASTRVRQTSAGKRDNVYFCCVCNTVMIFLLSGYFMSLLFITLQLCPTDK